MSWRPYDPRLLNESLLATASTILGSFLTKAICFLTSSIWELGMVDTQSTNLSTVATCRGTGDCVGSGTNWMLGNLPDSLPLLQPAPKHSSTKRNRKTVAPVRCRMATPPKTRTRNVGFGSEL